MKNFERTPHGKRGRATAILLVAIAICATIALLVYAQGVGPDADNDGMNDDFEEFFGLDTRADDSVGNHDEDWLSNYNESLAVTDPFNPDTDLDGWSDGTDTNPVSRAVFLWGEPRFTYGCTNVYVRPAWASVGVAEGGEQYAGGEYDYAWWLEYPTERLLMYLDPALISNDLWLAVAATGVLPGDLSAGLLDSNLVALTGPIALHAASEPWLTNRLPLAAWPETCAVSLQSTQGSALVVASVLYADADGDGFDDDQNAQLTVEAQAASAASTNLPPPLGGYWGADGASTSAPAISGTIIGFEAEEGYAVGEVHGQLGWAASNGVLVTEGGAFAGTRRLVLSDPDGADSVTVRAAGKDMGALSTNACVWISMRVRCVPGEIRPGRDEIGAAAFAMEGDRVVAFDGVSGEWVASVRTFPDVTGTWARADVRLDYVAKTYTLCFQGVAVHRSLGFADTSLTSLSSLVMRNGSGGDASLDNIIISGQEPEGLDFDGDGLPNAVERENGADCWTGDTDGDGLTDSEEVLIYGTNPALADTDGDTLSDSSEVWLYNSNPTLADTDGDGLADAEEVLVYGSDPTLADTDGDGIEDAYEIFFGLEVTADDFTTDHDGDGLTNIDEFLSGTDPFSADTDFDGWNDNLDACPVSRAVYRWGEPRLTQGATNLYLRPAWALDGIAEGGSAYAGASFGFGWLLRHPADRLLMPLDRAQTTNDLWMAVAAPGFAAADFAVSLLDTNLACVAGPFPIAAAEGSWMTNRLSLTAWPTACVVALQATQSYALVAVTVLYEDDDGDGFDNGQNIQLLAAGGAPLSDLLPPALGGGTGAVSNTNGSVSVSTYIGFENCEGFVTGALDGQQDWAASEGVQISASNAFEGTQSVLLTRVLPDDADPETALRPIGAEVTNAIVWVTVHARLVAGEPGIPANEMGAAAFGVADDRVVAFDGVSGEWLVSERTFPGATGSWARADICLDYTAKTYTLCLQGVAAHRDLGFADTSLTMPNNMTVRNGGNGDASLDSIVFSTTEPAGLDFDGDGIPNARERELRTDIWSADTDSDGITDAVEMGAGADPLCHDTDFDHDGIANTDETQLLGLDPTQADSDADGIPDAYLVADLAGSAFTTTSGVWTVGDGVLSAFEGSAKRVGYAVDLPAAGFHLVEFHLSNPVSCAEQYHLSLFCDDARLARLSAVLPPDGLTWRVLTPWLPVGSNLFRIAWTEDVAADRALDIRRLRLMAIDVPEATARAAWCAGAPSSVDGDADALTDVHETGVTLTAPTRFDSDGDWLWDGDERNVFRLNPRILDSDGDGLPDAIEVASRSGIETAARYVSHITRDFAEDGSSLVWLNSSAPTCAFDLRAVTSGFHVVELRVRNYQADPPTNYLFDFRASLLGRAIGAIPIAGDVDRAGTGRLITPWLPAGVHRFTVAWVNPVVQDARIACPALERVRLLAVNGEDADGDGMQDWMKERLLASTADSDGDGIKDRDEVLTHGSNPLATDTDGDGLTDRQELTLRTSLTTADTDGDGLSDGEEVNGTGTDPLADDFGGAWTALCTRSGSEVDHREGPLYIDGTQLVALGRGVAEYCFDLPTPEKAIMRLVGRHEWRDSSSATEPPDTSDFILYVDGQYCGRYLLHGAIGQSAEMYAVLPYLSSSSHRVRLVWNAIDPRLSLRIASVALGTLAGADADGDGIRDWVTAYSSRINRVTDMPITSPLSPVCVEGTARWPLLASATSGTNAVPVRPGIVGRWFADIPLDPSGVATPLGLSFENGANTAALSVTWTPLNLLSVTTLVARAGDTLRVSPLPPAGATGTADIALATDNVAFASAQLAAGSLLDIPLDTAGNWTLATVWTGNGGQCLTGAVTVAVLSASLPDREPACMLGRWRTWACPGIGAGATLETDAGAALSWNGSNATFTVSRMYTEHYIVARAGAGGSILDSRRIGHFWIQSSVDSFVRVVEQRDTSQVWENRMVSLGVPSGVDIKLRIFVGGVTFDDLSIERWVSGTELPEAGDYRFRLIHPNSVASSVCHTIQAYQDGILLGEAYHAAVGLPADIR